MSKTKKYTFIKSNILLYITWYKYLIDIIIYIYIVIYSYTYIYLYIYIYIYIYIRNIKYNLIANLIHHNNNNKNNSNKS